MGYFSRSLRVRKVTVTLVDDRTSAPVVVRKLAPRDLPESFFADTTLHVGYDDWSVVSAEPMTRREYVKTGQLLIRVRPVETTSARELLYSLPTLSAGLPGTDLVLADGTEIVLHEDDWRQCELVSASLRSLVDQELAAVRAIHEHERVGPGFRTIHLRKLIPAPIAAGTVTLEDLAPVVGTRPRRLFRLAGTEYRVSNNLFGVELDKDRLLYVLHADSAVKVIGLTPTLGPIPPSLRTFASHFGLLVVDWCRATAAAPDDLVS